MSGLLSPSIDGAVMDFDPYGSRSQADASQQFGALVNTSHGRNVFRFAKIGSAAIGRGKLELAPAPVANHLNLAPPAAQVNGGNLGLGSSRIAVALAGTAAANSQYDQGFVVVNAGTGAGTSYSLLHNNVQANPTGNLTLDLDDAIYVALDSTSRFSLVANPYGGVVEAASKTRTAAGIPLVDLPANGYGWLKTKGTSAALSGAAVSLGSRLTSDGSTAGAVTDNTDTTAPQTEVEVGFASIVAGTTGQYNPVVLSID